MSKILETWTVQPHGPVTPIDDRLLTVAGEIVMPLGRFPRRMTVVGLSGGRTAIWSAIALDTAGMAQVEGLGKPTFLIVPSDHHRLDARIWKDRYPDLKVIAPPGAKDGVEEAVPVDATDDILGDAETSFHVVPGTDGHESALKVRRKDGLTIVCNDIIGHVAHPHGLGAAIMARLMGFGVKEPQVPKPVRAKMIPDPGALAAQFRAWAKEPDLKRIIVSHGDPIEDDPGGVLTALAEALEEKA